MGYEAVIIGGGVIGLSIARELSLRGVKRIAVIERGTCGQESSWAAGGMLGVQAENVEFGDFYRLCAASRDMYPQLASSLLDQTGIDIGLDQNGTLEAAFSPIDAAEIEKRFEIQKAAGLDVEKLDDVETRRAEPFISPSVLGSLYFKGDWQVDNRTLLYALIEFAHLNNINVLENREVLDIETNARGACRAVTAESVIEGDVFILAAGAWSQLVRFGVLTNPIIVSPVRGQMLEFHTAKRCFDHVIYSSRGYIVPRRDGRILAGSTSEDAGFIKDNTESGVAEITDTAYQISPSLASLKPIDKWSGLRPKTPDENPIIGCLDAIPELIFATGHYRNGILLAPMTASIVADIVESGVSKVNYSPFSPQRFDRLSRKAK